VVAASALTSARDVLDNDRANSRERAVMTQPLVIEVVSDVVCPWCYLGKRRLDAALSRESEVAVRWRPFQLDATIPAEGLDRRAYMSAKFKDESRLAEAHARLKALGAEVGIPFDFEAIRRAPNTLDAHRLLRFATQANLGDAMAERLFADYFERGRDIGDRAVLADAARDLGIDNAAERLQAGEGAQEVRQEIEEAQRLGVEGVPFFIFASKYAVSGAQSEQVLAQAVAQARRA
jgi:predicted DsbA family dithiol-disulfide isomerase